MFFRILTPYIVKFCAENVSEVVVSGECNGGNAIHIPTQSASETSMNTKRTEHYTYTKWKYRHKVFHTRSGGERIRKTNMCLQTSQQTHTHIFMCVVNFIRFWIFILVIFAKLRTESMYLFSDVRLYNTYTFSYFYLLLHYTKRPVTVKKMDNFFSYFFPVFFFFFCRRSTWWRVLFGDCLECATHVAYENMEKALQSKAKESFV